MTIIFLINLLIYNIVNIIFAIMYFKITEQQFRLLSSLYESEKKNQQFWNWFKGSKVVNNDGSPKELYHGTNNKFDTFGTSLIFLTDNPELASDYSNSKRFISPNNKTNEKIQQIIDNDYNDINLLLKDILSTGLFEIERKSKDMYSSEKGTFLINKETGDETPIDYIRIDMLKNFITNTASDEGGGILRLYARIVNPFIIDAKGKTWDNLNGNGYDIVENYVSDAKSKGHDGIIIYNVVDGNMRMNNEYICFFHNQVKSAYDNNGQYSLTSDNIYESKNLG